MTKISTKDWRNLPTESWNTRTVQSFLIDETKRRFNAEYTPGGRGSKSKRWAMECGMIKRELEQRGPEVVRRFIEICWDEYYTSDPDKFPYPTFAFMLGYMDRYWTKATQEAEKEQKDSEYISESDPENIEEDWF